MAAFRQSTARLQQAASPAVTTLLKIMVDPAAPIAVKARCAYYVLDQTKKAIETEESEARVTELERTAPQKRGDGGGDSSEGSWRHGEAVRRALASVGAKVPMKSATLVSRLEEHRERSRDKRR